MCDELGTNKPDNQNKFLGIRLCLLLGLQFKRLNSKKGAMSYNIQHKQSS